MKRKIKNILSAVTIGACVAANMTSCESYLDVDSYFYDQNTIDSVFQSKVLVNEYINGIATYLPDESRLFTESPFPFGLASDECFASWQDGRHAGMYFMLGNETAQSEHFNNWAHYYKGIRKANILLSRIGECKDLSDMERRDYTGRGHFLRGYFYFCLLRQYGPVPIVPDTPFAVDTPADDASYPRNTYDECVDYICDDMEQAASLLPESRTQAYQYIPTKGAALAMISRLRLYAASPWYNGNTRYADWKTEDGKNFISQSYDNSKWAKAAVASKRVIDMNVYSLNTVARTEQTVALPSTVPSADFPNGAGNIDPYQSYKSLFDGSINAELVPEYIYYCNMTVGRGSNDNSNQWIATPYVLGGGNGLNVCLDLIDSYKMIDGNTIDHSSVQYPYPSADHAGDRIGGEGWQVSDGYTVTPNSALVDCYREARFYATIGYNHCMWPGTAYVGSDDVTNIEVTYYYDGNGGPNPNFPEDYNHTGYTCRKYIHQEDNIKGTSRAKTFAIIRYAEVLLNYVEALNELEGSYTDEATGITVTRDVEEMRKYFNMIRFRAGLPGITDAELNDVEKMREAIKLERKIEFALEGYRYHDLRRWGDADEAYNAKITGYNTSVRSAQRTDFYKRTILDSKAIMKRVFSQKMYFFPIPKTALDHNARLTQNPNW
jgi:hypothetical protein